MAYQPIKAKRVGSATGRSSKKIYENRFCEYESCKTNLSIYNTKKLCFNHRPVTYPRVRGHLPKEQNNDWVAKSDK